jgi:hypothetical protein
MVRRYLLIGSLLLAACKSAGEGDASDSTASTANSSAASAAASSITAEGLLTQIRDLSADSMEGRAPASAGEEKTVAYLTTQFQALGLKPGNPDGSWVQKVDLIGYTSRPTASFMARGRRIGLDFPKDYVANSRHERAETKVVDSDIVFVGYGVVAPEYGWDDYKGLDVKGKTLLMLINDPAVPLPNDSMQLDSSMFNGKAISYLYVQRP